MSSKFVVRWTGLALALGAASVLARSETHSNLQAVTSAGLSAWSGSLPFSIRGVLLCGSDEMLDSTPHFAVNPVGMGGEWQIIFQALEPGDRGGTTCWMGQNYGSLPWVGDELSYANEAWVRELLRLKHDPATGRAFQAGDLIEVTARRSLSYGGKRNINEGHDMEAEADFEIRLITANHGLPTPEVIALADVMNVGGEAANRTSWLPIFDPTRATGGERYQGMRVRLNNLLLVTTDGWNPAQTWGNRLCTVSDGLGRFLSLRHPRYSLGAPPTSRFDAVGIFTQESGSGSQGTNGYELMVQQVFPHRPVPEVTIGLHATVSWPASSDTFQLEWRSQMDAGEWTSVSNTPVVINGMNTVILPPSSPQRYYRLRKAN